LNHSGDPFQHCISGDHQLEYAYQWSRKGFTVILKLTSELGYAGFPDSLFQKQKDIQTIRYELSSKVNRHFHLSLNTFTSTPLYRMIQYGIVDTLGTTGRFAGSFLTPLVMVVSAGVKITAGGLGSFHVGLSSLKMVYLKDPRVFMSLEVNRFYGVKKGDQWQCEFGMSSSVDLAKKLTPQLNWQCRVDAFMTRNKPVDIHFKNSLTFKTGRSMNATLQSSIVYDKDLIHIFQTENLLTVGFSIRLRK